MTKHTQEKFDEEDNRSEYFGPIALTRHVKDDGRALLLYTRRDDDRGPVAREDTTAGDDATTREDTRAGEDAITRDDTTASKGASTERRA